VLKPLVKTALRAIGLRLVKLPGSAEYGSILPTANYTPWNSDREFLDIYRRISENTLVDIYRCWELWTMVGQTAKLDSGAILEVGVWRGGTGALMAKRAMLAGIKDSVYLCDTFKGVVKAGPNDTTYKGGEHSDTSEALVDALLQSLQIDNAKVIVGIIPDDATAELSASTFRLVHIDVDTYQSGKDIATWAWDRIVPGGAIVYDDYGFSCCEGIQRLVNEQAADGDKLVLHNLNGHAIVVKTGFSTGNVSPISRSATAPT